LIFVFSIKIFFLIFNIELDEGSIGFVLPVAQAPGVCNETYIGMKVFLNEVKKEVETTLNG
jgi:hypothetical protein